MLFHYCSTETFYSIVSNRSIRLSSVLQSNDSMEGKWVSKIFEGLCLQEGIRGDHYNQILRAVGSLTDFFDGIALCLSETEDMLSQWRGYANDGQGVCIGFSRPYLEAVAAIRVGEQEMPFRLLKVEYDIKNQQEKVKPVFDQVANLVKKGVFYPPSLLGRDPDKSDDEYQRTARDNRLSIIMSTMDLLDDIYRMKNPAFSEEKEWRLLSLFSAHKQECDFRTTANRIIPYREYKFFENGIRPIEKVILGPKHATPVEVVQSLLRKFKHEDVRVERSSASYR